jgi:hypothetical protein
MASKIIVFLHLFGPRIPRVSRYGYMNDVSVPILYIVMLIEFSLVHSLLCLDIDRIKFMGDCMFVATLFKI